MPPKTGANITVSLKDEQLLVRLGDIAQGADTTPLMSRFGEYFQKGTQDRFKT